MRSLWILFMLATSIAPLAGQVTTGSISGFAFDPDRRAVVAVKVTVSDPTRGVSRETTSDAAGFYRFQDLAPARYTLSAEAEKFAPASIQNVTVAVDSMVRVDFHLALAGRHETVTVNARVSAIQSETSDLGAVMDEARISQLPLNRRDFLQLALLTPGVLTPVENSELSTRGSFAMHANGAREEFNTYLLDGVDNNDQNVNRYVLQPSVDAIQEFKISTNNYSAEFGRSAGAQVNVITRSGTNEYHGFAYEYLRNRVLDARNYFEGPTDSKYIRNQFGSGAGGPVAKNRAFFFVSFDGLRGRQGLPRVGSVPTAALRAGDLSSLPSPPVDPFTGAPFPGNRIPDTRISPISKKILNLFPLPNLAGASGNYLSQAVQRDTQTQFSARLDYRLTERDQFALRYTRGVKDLLEPFAENSTGIPGFGDVPKDGGHNAMIQHVHTFGPSALNSFTAGFNRATRKVLPENYQTDVNKLWGVSYLPTQARDFGYPGITVAGYSQVGDVTSLPIDRAANTYQITDTVSLMHGNHGFKFGAEMRRLQFNGILDLLGRGTMTFSGDLSGAGISDLLLGYPVLGIQSQPNNTQTQRTAAYNIFAQDNWKLRPNLTLNLGLRYEYNTPVVDPTNRMTAFNLTTRTLAQVGTNGVTRSGYSGDSKNFAPRIGLAWTPAAHTVVRAGYGLFYDAGMTVVNSALYFNPPYFTIRVFFPSQTSLLTVADPFPTRGGYVPPASLSTLDPNLTTAYLQHWNLNVQREVSALGTVSVAYAGSHGSHLIRSRDLNQPRPGPGDVGDRAPYQGFSNIFFTESGGDSSYHSLQVSVTRPLARGLSLLAAYTWSKSIDDTTAYLRTGSDPNFPQDSRNFNAERALSSFDTPQRATIAYVYRLPGHSWWNRGTETRGIITAQSGQPFTPILRFDNSNTGNTGGNFGSDRPNLLHNPQLANRSANLWFDTAAFAIPAPYTFGSAGRNVVRGPAYASFEASLVRQFRVTEHQMISLEGQFFNLLNRTNLDQPEKFADEPGTFGKIFSAKSPRQVQFALRYQF